MTRESFESHVLPGRSLIADAAEKYRASFAQGAASVARSGEALRDQLFGSISPRVRKKTAWIISVDEPLHGVAFSALPAFDPAFRYLMESYAIRMIPGAAMIGVTKPAPVSDRFIAFADAIYNGADPRWTSTPHITGADLPRLPGTRDEVTASGDAWGGRSAIFTGARFTRSTVRQALSDPAAVAHIGAHVVPSRATRGNAAIVSSLNDQGTAEYLTPAEIASWHCPVGIVVLSGCHSGTGEALPGAGLVGLTRAWLVAGARAVDATHWPISDDTRPFFSTFYTHLQRHAKKQISASSAAASLRAAQVEALRRGGSHANPEYWAAFFVIGKE